MAEVFELLKRTLKARKMTYEALASALDVSVPTIKRLFVDQDCKLSRLVTLCDVLGLSVADLMDSAKRGRIDADYLPEEVEQAFVEHPALLNYYTLLREPISQQDIATHYRISEADTLLYCRDLERLGLLKLNSKGRVILPTDSPFKVRIDGPLQTLYAKINTDFVAYTLRAHSSSSVTGACYDSLSRQVRPETAEQIGREFQQLFERIGQYARQDQLVSSPADLNNYKWSFVTAPVSLTQFLRIGGHRDNKKKPRRQPN